MSLSFPALLNFGNLYLFNVFPNSYNLPLIKRQAFHFLRNSDYFSSSLSIFAALLNISFKAWPHKRLQSVTGAYDLKEKTKTK